MFITCPYGRQLAWHLEDSAVLVMKNLVVPVGSIFNPCVHQQRESRTPKFRILNCFCALWLSGEAYGPLLRRMFLNVKKLNYICKITKYINYIGIQLSKILGCDKVIYVLLY